MPATAAQRRGRHRQVVVADGVGDGVDHRRRRADGAGLAAALDAERIGRQGVFWCDTLKDGRSSARGMQ
jgi:hypothetical protein